MSADNPPLAPWNRRAVTRDPDSVRLVLVGEFEPAVPGATVATATDVAGNVSAPTEQTIVSVSGNFKRR